MRKLVMVVDVLRSAERSLRKSIPIIHIQSFCTGQLKSSEGIVSFHDCSIPFSHCSIPLGKRHISLSYGSFLLSQSMVSFSDGIVPLIHQSQKIHTVVVL